jgi:hypothetical protein
MKGIIMKRCVLWMMLLLSCMMQAQPKVYIKSKDIPFTFDSVSAGVVWYDVWRSLAPETTYNLYLKHSLFWKDSLLVTMKDGVMEFRFDSVRGRGANRQALITLV